jgi:hypothetical protein
MGKWNKIVVSSMVFCFTAVLQGEAAAEGTKFQEMRGGFHPSASTVDLEANRNVSNYFSDVPQEAVESIRFIVLSLGNQPLLKLKKLKPDLKAAGDHLNNVHPLKLWGIIFTDNEMIAAMHSIKNRKLVWKSFMEGMGDSLEESATMGNMKPEYIEAFAEAVKVEIGHITDEINKRNWNAFVKKLIQHVPREGDPSRYNM